ncbi:MAG TPA: HAMP domain-containing sensor histidine kinase [Lacibacter sp.]|nr:HAMP domain-containing sensor histidine kinase [Lacibacter sp.]
MKKSDEHVEEAVLENNVNENIALSRIAAMIVHDIKNPLNNILLACAAMEEMQVQKDQANYLELIKRNSNRINTLMTDLSLATNPGLRLNTHPVPIHTLLKEVLRSVKEAIHSNEIVVHYNYEVNLPHQHVDSELMSRALFNIILNAFEAVDEKKGVVEISIKTTDGVNCIIELKDNGTGIAEADEDLIFASGFTTKPGRHGLGLTIAKNILRQHNGDLCLLKHTGEGTIFAIRLNDAKKTGH